MLIHKAVNVLVTLSLLLPQGGVAIQGELQTLSQWASQQGWDQVDRQGQRLTIKDMQATDWPAGFSRWVETMPFDGLELDIQTSKLLKLKNGNSRLELMLQVPGQIDQPIHLTLEQDELSQLNFELSFYIADQTQKKWVYKEAQHDPGLFWSNVLGYLKLWQQYDELTQAMILSERLQKPTASKKRSAIWWLGESVQASYKTSSCLVAGWPGRWNNGKCHPINSNAFEGGVLTCNPQFFNTNQTFPRRQVPSDATSQCHAKSDINHFLMKKVNEANATSSSKKNKDLFDEVKKQVLDTILDIQKTACGDAAKKTPSQTQACSALDTRIQALKALACEPLFPKKTPPAASTAASNPNMPFQCEEPPTTPAPAPATVPGAAAPAAVTAPVVAPPAPTPPISAPAAPRVDSPAPVAKPEKSKTTARRSSSWSMPGWFKLGIAATLGFMVIHKLRPKSMTVSPLEPSTNSVTNNIGLPEAVTRNLPTPSGTR